VGIRTHAQAHRLRIDAGSTSVRAGVAAVCAAVLLTVLTSCGSQNTATVRRETVTLDTEFYVGGPHTTITPAGR